MAHGDALIVTCEKRKPKVLCDVDGVAADFIGGVIRWIKKRGLVYTEDQFTQFDISNVIAPEILKEIGSEIGFCNSLEWYPGAFEFLLQLRDQTDLAFVTAPWNSPTWEAERKNWLGRICKPGRVASIPSELKPWVHADFLIEDRIETLVAWLEADPSEQSDRFGILIDRPWNRHTVNGFYESHYMERVKSFPEALKALGLT